MPRLGGPAAALRIRARAPELPIVLTSGYDSAGGGMAFVPYAQRLDKPYAPESLLRIVRDALDRA